MANEQEKNEVIEEIKEDKISLARAEQEKNEVIAKLKKQEKITIRIPLLPNEKEGKAFVEVGLNCVIYQIMKGVTVKVPKAIYDILVESKYI